MTKTALCQLALDKLGINVTLVNVDSDVTAEAVQCKRHYDETRDYLLRSHLWGFATVSGYLVPDAETVSGTSTGSNGALTLADTTKTWTLNQWAGYYVWITAGTGTGQVRLIASNTTNEVLTVTQAWATIPDDTSDYEIWQAVPPYPWDYQFLLPSDYLRLGSVYPTDTDYKIEGLRLKSNESQIFATYIRQVTDVTQFDALFVEVFALALASKIVMPLLRDKVWQVQLQTDLARALSKARTVNLQETERTVGYTWNDARRG